MYHALYRKYRPQDFDTVVGQDTIIRTLRNSVKNDSFCHAYMFFGPRGTGKTTVSKIFARSVNCLSPVDGASCGICENCKFSYEKECVDIIEIDAASNNGVDEIRELKNKISLVPSQLKYKVYIIDEVHMLSIGAFNALLKTLEEPPEHAIFVLATTDPQKVPETIISRCQCFSFKRIPVSKIVNRLSEICKKESIDIDGEVLEEIAVTSDGGMRDSLGMLDQLSSYKKEKITFDDFSELNGVLTKDRLCEFCDFIFDGDMAKVLLEIQSFNQEGKNIIQIISQLMYFLRNCSFNYYVNNEETNYSVDEIQKLIMLINEKMFDIKRSGNPTVYIETLLIKFINDCKGNENISREIMTSSCEISGNKTVDKNISQEIKNEEVISQNNMSIDVNIAADVGDMKNKNGNIDETHNVFNVENDLVIKKSQISKIKNIDEIMSVRVNNTLALANKQILNDEVAKMKLLNDYTFDQEIGYVVCALLDAHIRAASEESMILSYEYDSVVKQNLLFLDKMIEVYNKITNSNKNIAIISDELWNREKTKYIRSIREGLVYKVIDEPEEIFEEETKDDIITSKAIELFGDIVEIE